MSTPLKLAAVAAALLAVILGGAVFLGGGGADHPSQTPSPGAGALRAFHDGPLDAGRYRAVPFGGRNSSITVSFTAPAGWNGFGGWALLGPKGTGAPDGVGVAFLAPDGVFNDPCRWDSSGTGQWPQQGDLHLTANPSTPARDLAASVAYVLNSSWGMRNASLAGHSGLRMDIQLPSDIDFTGCDNVAGHSGGAYFVFGSSDPSGAGLYAQGPGQFWHTWLLDVGSAPIVVLIGDYAGTPQADRDVAQSIVNSIVFTP